MIKEKFYLRLREVRKQYGVSQNELAEHLQLSRQSISQWENGKAYPDIDNIILLSKYFGMTVDEFLDVDGKYSMAAENCVQDISEEIEENRGENGDGCVEEEEKREVQDNPQWAKDMKSSFDVLVTAVLLVLAAMIPVVGVVAPVLVLIQARKHGTKNKMIYIICILGFILGTYNTYALVNYHFMPDAGTEIIEKVQ